MLIRIGPFEITECWDGVFYKKLSWYDKAEKGQKHDEIRTDHEFQRIVP